GSRCRKAVNARSARSNGTTFKDPARKLGSATSLEITLAPAPASTAMRTASLDGNSSTTLSPSTERAQRLSTSSNSERVPEPRSRKTHLAASSSGPLILRRDAHGWVGPTTSTNTPYASRGLTAALRLAKVAPSSPHALQFPAHIFNRMGLWHESIATNQAGAAVDDLFFKPHAMDFLVHSYLQAGQAVAAKDVVDQIATIKIIPHILDAFAAAAMPARHAIERRRWDEAAALSLPQQGTFAWKDFPHAEAALVFARALGAARGGDTDAAKKDLDVLQELRANLIKANSEGAWQEYWVSKIENDRQVVSAWIVYKHGRHDEALRMLRAAADHEDSTEWDPVMPGHIISARQNLGEMLLDANDPAQALQAFEAALKTEPFRFWSLYGAARAADLSGDRAKAEAYYAMLAGQT